MYAVENHSLVSNYALVENGVVTNIIWLAANNASEFPNAVVLGDLPVTMGDTYTDGKFYRNGKEVKTALTMVSEEISELTTLLGEAVQETYNSDLEAINNGK